MSDSGNGATLGIIGGAGVGAAARLYIDVAARVRAVTGELPRIALWNVPFGDELEQAFVAGEPDGATADAARRLLAEAVDRLVAAGSGVIAMPCNSLARTAAQEAARRQVPFVDMITATTDAVRASGARSAMLIATAATYAAQIYDGHGVEMIVPPSALRREASELIARTVDGPPVTGGELRDLVDRIRQPGVAVVLGCTDICGVLEGSPGEVVESLDCLAAACAQRLGAAGAVPC